MNLPEISFVPLQSNTLEGLISQMQKNIFDTPFLVHLRCRYENENEWEYITDACCLENFEDVTWFSDWWEGQEHVEYLGITQIKEEE